MLTELLSASLEPSNNKNFQHFYYDHLKMTASHCNFQTGRVDKVGYSVNLIYILNIN